MHRYVAGATYPTGFVGLPSAGGRAEESAAAKIAVAPRLNRAECEAETATGADLEQAVRLLYESLCAHDRMTPTLNNKGVSHESGSIER
ncbi:hypothetical protein REMIM1_PE00059 (plasmid) [Rhizobium etli bv. mimosae str. Mim1]|nr:hypothetical protein REMIM1_PE00059 [Rhizobium etli bv. mimosae str. Mim1]